MKYSIILVAILFPIHFLFSQTVTFTYDANGNRTGREWAKLEKLQIDSISIQKDSVTKIMQDAEMRNLKDEVAIYPNPTTGILDVKITGMKEGETSQCVF